MSGEELMYPYPHHAEQHAGLLPGGFVDDAPFGPPRHEKWRISASYKVENM